VLASKLEIHFTSTQRRLKVWFTTRYNRERPHRRHNKYSIVITHNIIYILGYIIIYIYIYCIRIFLIEFYWYAFFLSKMSRFTDKVIDARADDKTFHQYIMLSGSLPRQALTIIGMYNYLRRKYEKWNVNINPRATTI